MSVGEPVYRSQKKVGFIENHLMRSSIDPGRDEQIRKSLSFTLRMLRLHSLDDFLEQVKACVTGRELRECEPTVTTEFLKKPFGSFQSLRGRPITVSRSELWQISVSPIWIWSINALYMTVI